MREVSVNQDPKGEFEFHFQIGSKLFPEYPIRSHNEAFFKLKKRWVFKLRRCTTSISSTTQYRDRHVILDTACERILDAGFT
jgi:hypothetical protein